MKDINTVAVKIAFKAVTVRYNLIILFLLAATLILFVIDILTGPADMSMRDFMSVFPNRSNDTLSNIIFNFRIPKALTAMIVGVGLSISGLLMQTIFRNPMAGPDVLGISSGASLGVALVVLGMSTILPGTILKGGGAWIMVTASWIGAGAAMILIMALSVRIRDIMTILIIGIMLSGAISALVTIMQYFSSESMLKAYVVWTMGSLGNLTELQLRILALSVAAGTILSFASSKMLNALLLGENYAQSSGVNITVSRITVFASASVLAGSVTAFCGPVGFVGIAVPHLARIMFRTSDHRLLIPGTLLTGSSMMLASDIITQLPGAGKMLPLNSVTSLIGIPVVIWVVMRSRSFSGTSRM